MKSFGVIHESLFQRMLLFSCSSRKSFGKVGTKLEASFTEVGKNWHDRSKCVVAKLNTDRNLVEEPAHIENSMDKNLILYGSPCSADSPS